MTFRGRVMVLSTLAWLALVGAGAKAAEVDLEIVLAVDASGSVNEQELELQLGGVAAAFLDPSVQAAILSGPNARVAVALLVWSDSAFPKFTTDWFVLNSPQAATVFASVVAGFRSKIGIRKGIGIGGGGTAIGDAVDYAITMIDDNGIDAPRRVVDVSGDGPETPPWFGTAMMLPQARVFANERGVSVNGLAITSDFPHLDDWYRDNVIVGAGSFVIEARGFSDFKRAIKEKLWREFTAFIADRGRPVSGWVRVAAKAN